MKTAALLLIAALLAPVAFLTAHGAHRRAWTATAAAAVLLALLILGTRLYCAW